MVVKSLVEKAQNEIDGELERRHQEEFKGVARAMEDTEKYIVLKTIPTEVLISEIGKRCSALENRDKAIRELYHIPEE